MPLPQIAARKELLQQLVQSNTLQTSQPLDRKQYLTSLVQQVQNQPATLKIRIRHPEDAPYERQESWYSKGFTPPEGYSPRNLIYFWKGIFGQHKIQAEFPFVPRHMHRYLAAWIKEDGQDQCEAIVEYAVSNWSVLRWNFDIDTSIPTLQIIYKCRQTLAKKLAASEKPRTWGSNLTDWSKVSHETQAEVSYY